MEPSYRWLPGFGPDLEALDRLIQAGPRPQHPFGEGRYGEEEPDVYSELLEHNICFVRTCDLMRYFGRVTGMIASSGHWEIGDRWYHYLFAELTGRIPGIGNGWTEPDANRAAVLPNRFRLFECRCSLIELLADAYARFRPLPLSSGRRVRNPWEAERHALNPRLAGHTNGHGQAVLATLGQALMRPLWWDTEALDAGEFHSVMRLCVRYLPPEQIDGWMQSVLAIRHPAWALNLALWLQGMYWTIESEPPLQKGHYDPNPMPPFLTEENRSALKASLQRHLTQDLALDWADQIMALDVFDWEIEQRLEQFLARFFDSGSTIRW